MVYYFFLSLLWNGGRDGESEIVLIHDFDLFTLRMGCQSKEFEKKLIPEQYFKRCGKYSFLNENCPERSVISIL